MKDLEYIIILIVAGLIILYNVYMWYNRKKEIETFKTPNEEITTFTPPKKKDLPLAQPGKSSYISPIIKRDTVSKSQYQEWGRKIL